MQTEPLPLTEEQVLTVSALNSLARELLEGRFPSVRVRGEISNFRRPGSGHWYFTLKDERAQVRCAMFAGRNRFSRTQPADGAEVILEGRVSLYEDRGEYQIVVERMEAAGEGALMAAFEALKARLAAEGLFSADRKKPLPAFPRHLAIISSRSGAALRDVLSIVRRRFPCIAVTLLPVAVQGGDAERQILAALERVPALRPEVVLLTRGGGSLEDLFVFNSEAIARAIANCPVPTVAAIGHETDFTIAELIADLRGATPSAAAELIAPDGATLDRRLGDYAARLRHACATRIELAKGALAAARSQLVDPRHRLQRLMQRADELDERLRRAALNRLEQGRGRLDGLRQSIWLLRPSERIAIHQDNVQRLGDRARMLAAGQLQAARERLGALARTLQAVSPLETLGRGFAIVTAADGRTVTTAGSLDAEARIQVNFHDGAVAAAVLEKQSLPDKLRPLDSPPADDASIIDSSPTLT